MSDSLHFEPQTAFSPGHITGFFQIFNHTDPHMKGSLGGGLVLNQGIRSTVTPFLGEGETTVHLNGRKKAADFSDESANAVLTAVSELSKVAFDKYNSPFHFKIEESGVLPVGSGFGLSAAGALSAAYAINSALNLGFSSSQLTEIAHLAEVINGSGLGDVAGESVGGLAVREKPGGPLRGKFYSLPLSKIELQKKVYCLVLGELSTKSVITDEPSIRRINEFGGIALSSFLKMPNLESFMRESLYFTKNVGLLSPKAEKAISQISESGGMAAQAMLGDTVFAVSPDDKDDKGDKGDKDADDCLFNLMREFGDVYECRIETKGPYLCLPPF
ncbi:MAG: pantothenate kinase [Methanimicrococcus sp.]|nr:pantothenate kinase [Methanimicrococcus sp.]